MKEFKVTNSTKEELASWYDQMLVIRGTEKAAYDLFMTGLVKGTTHLASGHEAVAVLDGGLQAWQAAGGAVRAGQEPARAPALFTLKEARARLLDAHAVAANLGRPAQTLLDARAAQRFRGEVEPLDPVAGHIPGALNRPFGQNLGADGKFKPAAQLKAEFEDLLGQREPAGVVHHCGSGVSALPNLLAMEIAGLSGSALYAGSWSDWCSDPARPVAQG